MTRWAMVADLRRCVGCQTCTASCKHANATPPGVQWRRVLDMEFGEYPDVQRAFVPVGCQHCDEPPCMEVCPTTATRQRADGIVTIDYDLCIGCAYCAVACPYQARYKTNRAHFAFGEATASEMQRHDSDRLAVATKCTFCVERIDAGLAKGLKPGTDPEATPACVNACISEAMTFGDLDDPQSNVSKLLAENQHFRMHEELGTGPGFHYLWDRNDVRRVGANTSRSMSFGPNPWQQTNWDWRAAGNFIVGGAGAGLIVVRRAAARRAGCCCWRRGAGRRRPALRLARNRPAAARAAGLLQPAHLVDVARGDRRARCCSPRRWLRLARRAVHARSWPAALALAFIYCQARILYGAKGIPAWREPLPVPLIVLTGLTEGAGLLLLLVAFSDAATWAHGYFVLALLARALAWVPWRERIRAARPALIALDRAGVVFRACTLLPVAIALLASLTASLPADASRVLQMVSGVLAVAGGMWFKFTLVTRGAFNQGFALVSLPVRGVRRS